MPSPPFTSYKNTGDYLDATIQKIKEIKENQDNWRKTECINLIASENVTSPFADQMYLNDAAHRYAEGKTWARHYQGSRFIDEIDSLTQNLFNTLFQCKCTDLRPLSGTQSNMAAFAATANFGDRIMTSAIQNGGHVSHTKFGTAGLIGLKETSFPFDAQEMNIDIDATEKLIREKQPKIVLFGGSVMLFPHPIKELSEAAKEHGAHVMYDAAHVFGLIAGKTFQDPFREGADILTSSTHKTFPGPQSGVVMSSKDNETWQAIENKIFPQITCNFHQHKLFSLAVTAQEMITFGQDYATQTIKNAKALAQALFERGFDVKAENNGFTQSHQVLFDATSHGGGKHVAELLESMNIILNKNFIPGEKINSKTMKSPAGIRIGTQEMTRWGMKESEMTEIAELIKKAVIENKNVKEDVKELRKNFLEVNYCLTG